MAERNLHLTLRFLGDVEEGQAAKVEEAVRQGSADFGTFSLKIGGLGCFPPRGREVRIVWVGAEAEPLGALADRLEQRVRAIGFPAEEKPFIGHITLGRVREDRSRGRLREAIEKFGGANSPALEERVEAITLMQSELRPAGPVYIPLTRISLAGPAW